MHKDLKNILKPYYYSDLKRYGGNYDGAYILSESLLLKSNEIYSYGIGGNEESITFDRHLAALNKNIYMYDGSIDNFWGQEDRFVFKKENVSSQNIYTHIQQNNHTHKNNMILKMDIEAGEYETLLNCDENLFTHFNQITLELHGVISNFKNEALQLLNLLNLNYYLVHIHGNNHDLLIEDGVCNTLELTYIRRDIALNGLEVLPFTCPRIGLDFPNASFRPDVVMNWWVK